MKESNLPKNLSSLTIEQLKEYAMRDCSEYNDDDLLIAWELYDRMMDGSLKD